MTKDSEAISDPLEEMRQRLVIACRAGKIGVWDWWPQTGKLLWTEETFELLGVPRDTNLTLNHFLERIHPDDVARVKEAIETALRNHTPYTVQFQVIRTDGSLRKMQAMGEVFYDATGLPTRMVGTIMDHTERALWQERMLHAEKLASIGKLAAGVAHEINNPLQIIRGFAEELMRTARQISPPDRDHVALISDRQIKAVERIARIVEGMLSFARIDTTDGLVPTDVRKVISETIDLCSGIYAKERITFDFEQNSNAVFAAANSGKLSQVLLNLFSNSRDALEGHDSGRIRVVVETPGDCVVVTITDNGSGIKESTLGKIFDPYFTTKPRGKGTGIGLPLSRGIIESFGGTLHVKSEYGAGTAVTVSIPAATTQPSLNVTDEQSREFRFQGRALVIDDDADVLKVLAEYLARLGLDVVCVASGEEALTLLGRERFNVVFTDIKMPGMTGDRFLDEASKLDTGSARFIVMTGGLLSEFSENQRRVMKKIARGFLAKPFGQNEIVRTLHAIEQVPGDA